MYHQILRVLDPHLPLESVLANWNDITKTLAEPPRQRTLQLSNYFKE